MDQLASILDNAHIEEIRIIIKDLAKNGTSWLKFAWYNASSLTEIYNDKGYSIEFDDQYGVLSGHCIAIKRLQQ